ncbi:MAG: GNAT family N-acetyltransferase [Gemmatimonadaceae bacterium]
MSDTTFRIRRGEPGDAPALAEFAARTFSDTFAAANRPEDIAAYLPSAYGVSQQSGELTNPDISTLIMETETGEWVAYAMLRRGAAPDCVIDQNAVELWRFYVDRPWHGSGLAHRLLSAAHVTAAECAARTLWLGVWEKNNRAIAFYEKCGFRAVGAHEFWVGADRQTDRIMVCDVRQ